MREQPCTARCRPGSTIASGLRRYGRRFCSDVSMARGGGTHAKSRQLIDLRVATSSQRQAARRVNVLAQRLVSIPIIRFSSDPRMRRYRQVVRQPQDVAASVRWREAGPRRAAHGTLLTCVIIRRPFITRTPDICGPITQSDWRR